MAVKRMTAVGCAAAVIVVLISACGATTDPSQSPTGPTPVASPTTPPGPTPAVPTAAASPTAPSESSTTARWIGKSPDGIIVEHEDKDFCPAEWDLDLNLTTTGTKVTGTATTLLRKVEAAGPCGDVLNSVAMYEIHNGRIESGTISFEYGTNGTYSFTGTVSGTRMSGTWTYTVFPQSGRFAVTQQ